MMTNVRKFQNSKTELNECSKKDVNKEGTIDHKERNSTARSTRKLNGAHHGVRLLVEIQILHFLLLFFLYFF
jgi:ribosomal protein S2